MHKRDRLHLPREDANPPSRSFMGILQYFTTFESGLKIVRSNQVAGAGQGHGMAKKPAEY